MEIVPFSNIILTKKIITRLLCCRNRTDSDGYESKLLFYDLKNRCRNRAGKVITSPSQRTTSGSWSFQVCWMTQEAKWTVCILSAFVFVSCSGVNISMQVSPENLLGTATLSEYFRSCFHVMHYVTFIFLEIIAPAGISPRGEIPRRHPSNSRVY